jgi:hypothetical protein
MLKQQIDGSEAPSDCRHPVEVRANMNDKDEFQQNI